MSTDIILVTGATGNIGTALVAQLTRRADQPLVRAATRDIQSPTARLLHAMNPATIHPITFDANDPDSLRAACEGITKLCIIAPFVPDMAGWHMRVMEAAFEAHCQALGISDAVKNVYKEAEEGWFAPLKYAGFERVTGRRPTPFAKFAYDHAAYYQSASLEVATFDQQRLADSQFNPFDNTEWLGEITFDQRALVEFILLLKQYTYEQMVSGSSC